MQNQNRKKILDTIKGSRSQNTFCGELIRNNKDNLFIIKAAIKKITLKIKPFEKNRLIISFNFERKVFDKKAFIQSSDKNETYTGKNQTRDKQRKKDTLPLNLGI